MPQDRSQYPGRCFRTAVQNPRTASVDTVSEPCFGTQEAREMMRNDEVFIHFFSFFFQILGFFALFEIFVSLFEFW